jgi:ribose transport system ATP-binding protein
MLTQLSADHIRPDDLVGSLSGVDRALVAIVRAVQQVGARGNGVLVLDEPTAYLSRDASEQLFATMRRIAGIGCGVIFVSHRLEEVRTICDRVTVLRDGALVDTTSTRDLTEQALLEKILGRALGQLYPVGRDVDAAMSTTLHAELRPRDGTEPFGLSLQSGEVLGLTGLLGMGHERIPYVLFGADKSMDGSITVSGKSHPLPSFSPRSAINSGLALLPADRLGDSSGQSATLRENVTLPSLARYFSGGFLHYRAERRRVSDLLAEFEVTPPQSERIFAELSGGNQQKALVAKWFEVAPKVLLLHEPTQGVDVGARKQIFQRIRDFADGGGAVLIASVEYDDLAHLCNRVIVFRYGRPVSELRKPNLTEALVADHSFRTESGAAV